MEGALEVEIVQRAGWASAVRPGLVGGVWEGVVRDGGFWNCLGLLFITWGDSTATLLSSVSDKDCEDMNFRLVMLSEQDTRDR